MIERITSNNIKNIQISNPKQNKNQKSDISFGGVGSSIVKGIQKCEKNPMLNVAVIDLITAIVPRSIIEGFTNIFAGFEALRREGSGLLINCLLPGFVALGIAKLANKSIMGKNADLSNCWADSKSISTISDYYTKAETTPAFTEGMQRFNDAKKAKVYAAHYNMLSDVSGVDGNEIKKFKDITGADIHKTAETLTNATFEEKPKLSFTQRLSNIFKKKPKSLVKSAYEDLVSKTHIEQNIRIGSGENKIVTNLESAMQNSTSLMRGFVKDGVESAESMKGFVKKSKNLLKTKSILAMAIILPLAASMQFINRKITSKLSGVTGAPIYEDYAQNNSKAEKTPEEQKQEKEALLKQKMISIASMLSVACLSMMKLPTLSTLKDIVQFKGRFPTMDQARAISAITFSSRMAVADDKNELAEATTRDLVTFSSMYFLGDYAAKGYATYLEKSKGVNLLNRTKVLDKKANPLKKFGNWVVNTHLKSSDELVSDGIRSLEEMTHFRAKCQAANIGSSLLILGLIVPIFTRMKTKKNHEKELMLQDNKDKINIPQNQDIHDKIVSSIYDRDFNSTFTAFKQQVKESK